MNKLTKLTPAQQDRMASFAQEWIEYGWRTTPLTEEEWAVWEAGVRKCYELAGIRWPGVIVRIPSPIVGAFAAPIAIYIIDQYRKKTPRTLVGVWDRVSDSVGKKFGDSVGKNVRDFIWDKVRENVGDRVADSVADVGDRVADSVADVWAGVWSGINVVVRADMRENVRENVVVSIWSGIRESIEANFQTGVWEDIVDRIIRADMRDSVRENVVADIRDSIRKRWLDHFAGRHWCDWSAFIAYFRDVVELQLDPSIWEKARAYEDAMSAGYWWPTRDFVMVCDLPDTLHIELAGGRHRLHCDTGPAIAWADGWGIYSWHGTNVPSDLIEKGWDIDRIIAERNVEVRRCAIEKFGWNEFVVAAGLKPIDECPDPGNPGQTLRLFDVPREVLDLPLRILVMHNATEERGGDRHTFGITTPADCETALEAVAWTFDLSPSEYNTLERAT